MLTREENQLLTRTGPDAPMGKLLRRYWQPAALAEELPAGGAPLPVRVLGEDLVLFRDDQQRPALLGIHCSHRGADLSYGRVEDGGLRCIYHGWLYDSAGHCLEQPGEPAEQAGLAAQRGNASDDPLMAAGPARHQKIRHLAYPCVEQNGLILAYLGPGEPPLLPHYEWLAPDGRPMFVTKILQECNFLQANEGNIDPPHQSFLHRQLARGGGPRVANQIDLAPFTDAEETEFGVRVFGVRRLTTEQIHVGVRYFVLPNITKTASAGCHWHVPIDDERHWKYVIEFRRDYDDARLAHAEAGAGYQIARSKSNRYRQDREEMKTQTFAGLGTEFQGQDTCAVEGAGPIQDRAQEHLGQGDRGIALSRQLLLRAIDDMEEGLDPPHVIRDPGANSFPDMVCMSQPIPAEADWRTYWQTLASTVAARSQ